MSSIIHLPICNTQINIIKKYSYYNLFRQVLFLLGTFAGIIVCCLWCLLYRRPCGVYMCSFACCIPRNRSEHDSAGSVYPPPRYSRCGSIHQAPPPYSEVYDRIYYFYITNKNIFRKILLQYT